jgi:pilus assembly protein Flp/PilA
MENAMKNVFVTVSAKIQALLIEEDGQDLIEYALLAAMIALAVTASFTTIATDLKTVFTSIGTQLTSAA